MSKNILPPELENQGPIWKHPYAIYIALTLVLFSALLLITWFAWTQDWIPNRGTLSHGRS